MPMISIMDARAVSRPLRIGFLALHWEFFDGIMPPSFRQEKESISEEVKTLLAAHGEVIYGGLLTSEMEGKRQLEIFRDTEVDCIVVFVHMATPGSYPWTIFSQIDVPIFIWNAHLDPEVPPDYDMAELCRRSSNVGTLMLTNVLLRAGRSFHLVTSTWQDAAARRRLSAFLRAARVATSFGSARIGLLGCPMEGYLDVEVNVGSLKEQIGPEIVSCSRKAWEDRISVVSEPRIAEIVLEYRNGFEIVDLEEEDLAQSARVALALESWMEEESLQAAAINCHTDFFRHSELVGIAACLGASRQTSRGKPITCTGDIPTTIAMLIGKLMGSAVLYCECDAIDYTRGTMVMANTGECDYSLCKQNTSMKVCPNEHFGPGTKRGKGACHYLSIAEGSATLLSFSPNAFAKGGWSLIAAPGTILGTFHEKLLAGNCEFRFAREPVAETFNAWAQAGATHHSALCTGDLREEVLFLAEMLKIEGVVIA